MKWAFLYAGQGSQKVGMGKDFYENYPAYRDYMDGLCVEIPLKRLMHFGPMEELSDTKNTQACMAAFAAGITDLLATNGIRPQVTMGLSLGEYGALYAAGVYDRNRYVDLTAYRGAAMQKASAGRAFKMSAVLGMKSRTILEICEDLQEEGYVTISNYNCKEQYVICGDEKVVCRAEERLKERGAKRCIPLKVSGPFHTEYMSPAGEALREYFQKYPLAKPKIPVLLNATGDYYRDGDDLAELLVRQVQSSVRLEECLEKILQEKANCYLEIGPGRVLTGFLEKMSKDLPVKPTVMHIETVKDLEEVIAFAKKAL